VQQSLRDHFEVICRYVCHLTKKEFKKTKTNKPDITIITPFFNGEANIPTLIRPLDEFIKKNTDRIYEMIFVDDGSIDNSLQLLTNQ